MALTGLPISGVDACRFNIAENIVSTTLDLDLDIREILTSMDLPMPTLDLRTEGFTTEHFKDNLIKINDIEQNLE